MKKDWKKLLLILMAAALLIETILLADFYRKERNRQEEQAEVDFEEEIFVLFDEAIENRQIEVYYQPIISCETEAVCAEALSRWKVNGEYLSPSVFVSVLESTGQVTALDEYVFESVCTFQAERLKQGKDTFPISVNLSVLSSLKDGVAEQYAQICEDLGAKKELISVEITETLDSDPALIQETVKQFQSLGFQAEIDDFGAGYSNYSALSAIGYDIGKLDKSLVDSLESEREQMIVKDMIALFKKLGMKVVAEGVEEEGQVTFLKENGCDAIQGYYYSRPLDEASFIDYLESH